MQSSPSRPLAPHAVSHTDGASLEDLSLTPDAELARFGMNLRRLREARQLSRAALGHQIGASGKAVEHWEEATGNPAIRYLVRLSLFFDVSIDELSGIERDPEQEQTKFGYLLKLHQQMDEQAQRLAELERAIRAFRAD
jgi:transcriptional regulator with XRE-family HTH domain